MAVVNQRQGCPGRFVLGSVDHRRGDQQPQGRHTHELAWKQCEITDHEFFYRLSPGHRKYNRLAADYPCLPPSVIWQRLKKRDTPHFDRKNARPVTSSEVDTCETAVFELGRPMMMFLNCRSLLSGWNRAVSSMPCLLIGLLFLHPANAADCGASAGLAVDWRGCEHKGLLLRNTRLSGGRFEGADMVGSLLIGVDLRQSTLADVVLSGSSFRRVNFHGARLPHADLSGSLLRLVVFDQADLRKATLRDSNIQDSSFSGADLQRADLRDCVFSRVRFNGADLRRADLRNSLLTEVDLSGADLSGAIWTDGTVCAPGSLGVCRRHGPNGS